MRLRVPRTRVFSEMPAQTRVRPKVRSPQPRRQIDRRRATLDARASEAHALLAFRLTLMEAEQSYAAAALRLEEFDRYLAAVRARLHAAGYL